MSGTLYQLTFIATRRSETPGYTDAERLNRYIGFARECDRRGLTGVMLQRDTRNLFHLEGEEGSVVALYERIKTHVDAEGVVILRQRESDTRSFTRWGFAMDNDPRENQPPHLADRLVSLVVGAPPEIRQTFLAFARLDPPGTRHRR